MKGLASFYPPPLPPPGGGGGSPMSLRGPLPAKDVSCRPLTKQMLPQLCVACRYSAPAAAWFKRASSLMVVSKSVTPSATYSCQGRLTRTPYVWAFPLKRLSGRQRDREHGSGRLCLHTLEVTLVHVYCLPADTLEISRCSSVSCFH